ncbi:MAG TPA: ABC transporter ATP-binding protein, partial [Acidimicrobiia bacterium]
VADRWMRPRHPVPQDRGMALIEVRDLTKRYGDRTVVDGVTLSVEEGEIFAILGPNGAGKTTTVEMIGGLRRPDGGSVRVEGLDPTTDSRVKQILAMQLQESQFADRIRVGEALELFSSFYPSPVPWRDLMDELGLAEQERTMFSRLSGGQRQRLSIAAALVGDPKIAILDELTTGLDPKARRDTWGLIEGLRDRGVTIVLVTHFMEEAERLADRVAVIDRGRLIVVDTPQGLVSRLAAPQVMRFRPGATLDPDELRALAEVESVTEDGGTLTVTGNDNVVYAVTAFLARRQIVAHELRVDTATLDDAFLALTGRKLDTEEV